jgi:hypothetical protein
MQQQRQVREQLLREHVGTGRRIHLAVDGERQRSGQSPHRHCGRRTVPVVQQVSCGQSGFAIDLRSNEGRVLVDTAGEQGAVPGRTADEHANGASGNGQCRHAPAPR